MTGALIGATALASAGLLLVSADFLVYDMPLAYLLDFGGLGWKVAGIAALVALVAVISHRMSSRGLFLGALVSSAGLAIVAAGLLLSSINRWRTPGAVGATLGLFVACSWWSSDRRRSRGSLHASVVLAALLASFLLVIAARSFGEIARDPFPHCRNGISLALQRGGSSFLCMSLITLVVTGCWARRRAGRLLRG